MKHSFAILGLGRFGKNVAEALYQEGADIIVADRDEETINRFSEIAVSAVVAELSDAASIKAIGLSEIETVIVAMGENLEASIISTMVAKECGVPYVIAKASSKRMGDILMKVGADRIVYPEEEAAFRTAKHLISDNFLDYYDLDDTLCIVKLKPRKEWIGKSISELRLRNRYHLNVVAVREEKEMLSHVDPERKLTDESTLLVVTEQKELNKLK